MMVTPLPIKVVKELSRLPTIILIETTCQRWPLKNYSEKFDKPSVKTAITDFSFVKLQADSWGFINSLERQMFI